MSENGSKYPPTNLNDNIDNLINELEGVSALENIKTLKELFPMDEVHKKCLESVNIYPIDYDKIIKIAQDFNFKNNLNWITNNVLNITAMANSLPKKEEKKSFLQKIFKRSS